MKRKRSWLLCPLVIVALLLCAIPAYADIPTLPHAFYGTLTVVGSPAAVGTVVTAKVDDVECGSITTTVEGQYGGSGAFDPKLTVSGEIATGAEIKFYVNDFYTGEDYDYAFSPGAVTEHNLTANVDPDPPVVTITPLSPDPTVGTGAWRAWTAATATDGAFDSLSEDYTFTIPTLADGGYIVSVRATDAAGNITAEADYATDSFTVDTTPPTVTDKSPAADEPNVPVTTTVTAQWHLYRYLYPQCRPGIQHYLYGYPEHSYYRCCWQFISGGVFVEL